LAEAYLWYGGDFVENCKAGGSNRFGIQVLVRLSLIIEVVVPWLATRIYLPKSLGIWFILYPIYMNIGPIIGYYYEGDDAAVNGVWNYVSKQAMMCAVVSPMGWLKWGKGHGLMQGQIWS